MKTIPCIERGVPYFMKKITIEDVARHAGVGIATVSRAMNNADGIVQRQKRRFLRQLKN